MPLLSLDFQLGARWSESQSQRCILMGYLYVLCDWFFFSFILLRDRIMPIYQMQKRLVCTLRKERFSPNKLIKFLPEVFPLFCHKPSFTKLNGCLKEKTWLSFLLSQMNLIKVETWKKAGTNRDSVIGLFCILSPRIFYSHACLIKPKLFQFSADCC